jgi:hypothetical protein
MVGFTLMHAYSVLAAVGFLSWMALTIWIVPAIYILITRRKRVEIAELAMLFLAILVAAAVMVPDNLFA